jgi:hypothetical protein
MRIRSLLMEVCMAVKILKERFNVEGLGLKVRG